MFVVGFALRSDSSANSDHFHFQFINKKATSSQESEQQFSENNENEYEDDGDFEIASISLPFIITFREINFSNPLLNNLQVFIVNKSQPIYLAVRQFLI